MKRFLTIIILLFLAVTIKAELTPQELAQLSSTERSIYLNQLQEIIKKYEKDIFQAEDMIRMGKEMKSDNAKFSGAYYVAKGMDLKEKAEKDFKIAQQRLDSAAREAIKRNKKR